MYRLMMSGTVFGQFLQVVPVSCLAVVIYAIIRCVYARKYSSAIIWPLELTRGFFVCYLTGLINLTLVPANFWSYIWFYLENGYSAGSLWSAPFSGGFNLRPTMLRAFGGEMAMGSWVRTMLVGNLLMFLPLGVFLPVMTNRINKRNILIASSAIPVAVEVIQLVIGRSFDFDDILLDFAGILLGFLAGIGIRKKLGVNFK